MWKHWTNCRTFWSIFTTLVLLPIYSSVSIYQTFTTWFIVQCPVWLAVSTPVNILLLGIIIIIVLLLLLLPVLFLFFLCRFWTLSGHIYFSCQTSFRFPSSTYRLASWRTTWCLSSWICGVVGMFSFIRICYCTRLEKSSIYTSVVLVNYN